MSDPQSRSFSRFYMGFYLASMLLGVACFALDHDLIFLIGFCFFGCFMAARAAMRAVLSSLSITIAWLLAFVETTVINLVLVSLAALVIWQWGIRIPPMVVDNLPWLLVAVQLLSASFIFSGLKWHSSGVLVQKS